MDIQPFDRNSGRQLVTRSGQETLPKSQGSFICQCYNGRVEVEWWWHKLWEKQCWDAHLCTNGCKGLSHEESHFSIQTGRWCILLWTAGENGPFNNTCMFLWPTSWNVSLQDVYAARQRLIWACSRWGPAVSQRSILTAGSRTPKNRQTIWTIREFSVLWFGALVLGTLLFQRLCFAELAFFFSHLDRWCELCSNAAMLRSWRWKSSIAVSSWRRWGSRSKSAGERDMLVYLWYLDLQVYTERCIHIPIYTKCI